MVTWSSILDYYHLHRRELHRYGIAVMLIMGGLYTHRPMAALAGFLFLPVLYAYHRWGETWRKRGEQMMKPKPRP